MLLDHFHPPLSDRSGWKGFHNQWAAVLAADLNERLPEGWKAQPEVEFGIEIDVGVVDEAHASHDLDHDETEWVPPNRTIPFTPTREKVEVQIVNYSYGPSLMGAIELVSPANKDRTETRGAFASKCLSILSEGAGLIVIDIVTSRRANLHAEIMQRLRSAAESNLPSLYASAFRPARLPDNAGDCLQVWEFELELEHALPIVPLYLRVGPMMPIDLQRTYAETCRQLRIAPAAPLSV